MSMIVLEPRDFGVEAGDAALERIEHADGCGDAQVESMRLRARTGAPHWASTALIPMARVKVLLPAMFGPLMIMSARSRSRSMSLATARSVGISGWLRAWLGNRGRRGRIRGRRRGMFVGVAGEGGQRFEFGGGGDPGTDDAPWLCASVQKATTDCGSRRRRDRSSDEEAATGNEFHSAMRCRRRMAVEEAIPPVPRAAFSSASSGGEGCFRSRDDIRRAGRGRGRRLPDGRRRELCCGSTRRRRR